jgi:predicted ribosomally synthesized peptide with SipW-like signal peptide
LKKLVIIFLSLALLIGGTFAYFTDHETTTATGTAGTVAIELNNLIDLLDEDGYDVLGPGDMISAAFEVVNMGNKSIDVRTTIALTIESEHSDLTFSGDTNTQSEYDLYAADDVEFVKDYGYKPKEGAKPIQYKSVKDNVIFYEIPEYSLNGNSEVYDEVETINGTGIFKHLYGYVLVLKHDASYDWQDSNLTIDILVEAKQHENTSAGWEIVAKETVTQGSITKQVAVEENRITN